MNYEKFAILIKEARLKMGLTQKDVADMLYVTDRAVSKWERGKSLPDITMLKNISEILKLDVNELLEIKNIEKKKKNYLIYIIIILPIIASLLFIIFYRQGRVSNNDLQYVISYKNRNIFYNNIDDFIIDDESLINKINNGFDFINFMERLDKIDSYFDGGSVMYSYLDYNILSCKTNSGNNDIIIGSKYMKYQDNFCKNDEDDYSKCTYTDIFRVVDIKNDYMYDDPDYGFILLDKFQDSNPIIVKMAKSFINSLEINEYYEFKFLYYYPNNYSINSDIDIFNYYELIGVTKVYSNGLLNTNSNSCERISY